ncbi:MBL fold metallo-hydrolase [Planobispora siamensis]|uniref:Metallo-beta-lactamase domain-containing protein n=1 Tax=Planobispora siamensis TaxID=936338 RepID=A0A8J3SNY5_9ACTN|nr:MBL fold metallo-hydrolase [Planobispora siamensis]GIH95784.1 hypothetical protein Psi01_64140 [Planobispora siamensis]
MRREPRRNSGPQEIAEDVFLLALGCGVTACNVYFVRSGSSWALIDTGWRKQGRRVREAAERLFGAGAPPAAIVLTHLHPDHSGSLLELVAAWKPPVYVHPDELPLAAGGYVPQYANPLDRWLVAPVLRLIPPRTLRRALAANSVAGLARSFDPEGAVPGLPGWECVATPGHTPGHSAFLRRRDGVLITGDAALTVDLNRPWNLLREAAGVYGPPYVSTWNWPEARRSVAALARLEPRVLARGHGPPLVTGAAPALHALVAHR